MARVTQEAVEAALRGIIDPGSGRPISDEGLVSNLVVKDGNVGFVMEVPADRGHAYEPVRKAAEDAIRALPGVLSSSVVMTAHRDQAAPAQPAGGIDGVNAIVAVASGKGGVGKSTTAANLALALAAGGHKVVFLDADIYGPSAPRLFGLTGKPETDGTLLYPKLAHGIATMSIGLLIGEDQPMVWRGPMVQSALEQMLRQVAWGEADIMIVDLPPGTGDIQLSLTQRTPLAGAVIVSTPQDLSLIDARKGLNMFRKVDVPILGIVENMSYFACPACGHRTEVFAHGGARQEAARLGVPFLGEIPLDIRIRETSDSGLPIVAAEPGGAIANAYQEVASAVLENLPGARPEGPRIVIE